MNFTPINLATWPRREVFAYFSRMAPTGYSLTTELNVTPLRATLAVQEGSDPAPAPDNVTPSPMALTEPVYPDFPTYPQEPENGNWDAYSQQYDAYRAALRQLRGDGLSQEVRDQLHLFSGRSTPLALA